MKKILTATAACAALATSAYGQAPAPTAPKPAAEPSGYCRSAAQILLQGDGDAEIAAVARSCRRGDIIAINTGRRARFSK
ncbi:hypothetical protein [Bradyrhizobium sp. CB2312]|uniref:hypothetical protein n=1 Tax=Bradyrhizobium sp. CB2312 TaxID=3039155 RepID=UPI0024B11723|nr:hypothetical protein [Bradyrhizobium sp. CB2312]WFU71093.1 hypothetical protein QA642_38465 [Bradyrhizobium sp. CB2312]